MSLVKAAKSLPPLEPGDRLTRAEFERRYEALETDRKAELLDGIVYMPSPSKYTHGKYHGLITGWLVAYQEATPGVEFLPETSLRLDDENEPKPDAMLRIVDRGRSEVDEDDFVAGPAELVVEVAVSSVSYDLHVKKDVYRRQGCREYLVVLVHDEEVRWFGLRGRSYQPLPTSEGVIRSRVFPGLWLDTRALLARDLAALLKTLRTGIASPEHARFVSRLGLD